MLPLLEMGVGPDLAEGVGPNLQEGVGPHLARIGRRILWRLP